MRPTVEQLKKAIEIRSQIERLEKELMSLLLGDATVETGKSTKVERPKKRVLSPEARERIAAAQRERWRRQKSQQQPKQAQK